MATFPTSVISFAVHSDTTDTIFAADVNTPNAEIVAIETDLLNGVQHNLAPSTDDTYSLGSTSKRWLKVWAQDLDADGNLVLGNNLTSASVTASGAVNGASMSVTNGLLDVSAAGSGQVKFPATENASANANTLDDYSEGTWTPTDGSGASLSLTVTSAKYTKVGDLVYVSMDITYPSTGNGSNAAINGLPYTAVAANGALAQGFGAYAGQWEVGGSTNTIAIYPSASATPTVNSALSTLHFIVAGCYKASA